MDNIYDVIVVGSGATAMYFGYKAIKLHYEGKILFLSKDCKSGGRIHSFPLPRKINSKKEKYKAEICALRYFDSQPIISKVSKELNMEVTRIPPIPIVNEYNEKVNIALKNTNFKSKEISLPAAITLTCNNSYEHALQTGYIILNNNVSLDFYYKDYQTSNLEELRFKNGFESFINKMEKYVIKLYNILYNSEVIKVEKYSGCYKIFTQNECYYSKKIVYTGTFSDFNKIFTKNKELLNRRIIIENSIIISQSFRCYINYTKPFWGNNRYKYTCHPIINQLIYYSTNTILIYLVGDTANTIMNMIPIDIRENHSDQYYTPGWENINKFKTLYEYIYSQIDIIINSSLPQYRIDLPTTKQLNSASHILLQYRPQLGGFPKPIQNNDKTFENIQKGENF